MWDTAAKFSPDLGQFATVLFGTVLFYAAIVVSMRISGKRTLAQFSTFDFVVNIAIGSTVPAAILSSAVTLWAGVVVIAALVGLQWIVAGAAARWPRLEDVISNPPRVLVYRGEYVDPALRLERVSRRQLESRLRQAGITDLSDVSIMVMETTGNITVIGAGHRPPPEPGRGTFGNVSPPPDAPGP